MKKKYHIPYDYATLATVTAQMDTNRLSAPETPRLETKQYYRFQGESE
jgi:hypothetical protein